MFFPSSSMIKWPRYIPTTKFHPYINSHYCWNYSLLSNPLLWPVTSKDSNMYAIAYKKPFTTIDVFDPSCLTNIEYDFLSVSIMMISFHNLFQKSNFFRTLKKFKNSNKKRGRVIQNSISFFLMKAVLRSETFFLENLVERRKAWFIKTLFIK